jgi:IclR family transcriptional regulator, pca regulon regulatory protein
MAKKLPSRRQTHRLPLIHRAGSNSGDPNFMSSLARGLAILQAFDARGHALSVSQASIATGIPRAAARRCLYTLEALGFMTNHLGHYSLRPKVLTLGFSHLSSLPLATAAQPLLNRCRDRLRESCSLGVLDGSDVFYLARAETIRIMSVSLYVGTRLPAYCTSMGRVLLAHLSDAALEVYMSRTQLVPRTSKALTSTAELRAVLGTVRRLGYAIVDQELELGLRSIAVPVFDRAGCVVASLNAGTSAVRVTLKELTQRLLPELRRSAADLQSAL